MPAKKTAYIATGIMGSVAFDAKGEVIDKELFPKDAQVITGRLEKSRSGQSIEEEQKLMDRLEASGFACAKEEGSIASRKMREEFRAIALSLKWAGSQAEINSMLSAVSSVSVTVKLKETKTDRILMSAIGVSDELDKVVNVFSERLREWYGFHFPEAARSIADNERFARIAQTGVRGNSDDEEAKKLAKASAGMEFSAEDMEQVRHMAGNLVNLFAFKAELKKYVETAAGKAVPNTAAVAGPALALRLLVLAGGLEKLCKMPSSTIQMLGAEKALFRHLKGRGKSPKHGILFSHELVQGAPHELKGKVARLVAAKIAMAARVDYFSKDDRGAKMRAELDEQVRKSGGVVSKLRDVDK
jgi:nucleolar protein 56